MAATQMRLEAGANLNPHELVTRKAEKLGLHSDHEWLLDAFTEASRFAKAYELYKQGVFDIEMRRLSGGEKSSVLDPLYSNLHQTSTAVLHYLPKWQKLNETLEDVITGEINAEARQKRATELANAAASEQALAEASGHSFPAPEGEGAMAVADASVSLNGEQSEALLNGEPVTTEAVIEGDVQCDFCGERGHIASDCTDEASYPQLSRMSGKEEREGGAAAETAAADEVTEEDGESTAASTAGTKRRRSARSKK